MELQNNIGILTTVSKEIFRRRLLVSTRIIAVFLIMAIVYIGFVQIKYVAEVNKIKAEYGSLGYCYLCGLETYRKCECQYFTDLQTKMPGFNITAIAENAATYNVRVCEIKKGPNYLTDINLTN